MFRNLINWFNDENHGTTRKFYLNLGLIFFGLFAYTNYFRINDYDEIKKERLELIKENQKHIAREAALEKELEIVKVEINRAVNALTTNKNIDQHEKNVIDSMSIHDKLDYLARAGYLQP